MNIAAYFDLRYTTRPEPTGVDKHIAAMVKGLADKEGVSLTALLAKDQYVGSRVPSNSRLAGFPAESFPLTNKQARAWWGMMDVPPVDRWITKKDWIYSPQELFAPSKVARTAVTIHGITFFEKTHPQYSSFLFARYRLRLGWFLKRVCRSADLILPVSPYLEKWLVENMGLDPHKSVVVGNGVDDIFYAAADSPEAVHDPKRFLVIGGLNGWDGGEHVLGFARLLRRQHPDCQIRIAGNMHEPHLLNAIRELGNCEILGFLNPAELIREMKQAMALIYLPNVESFGMAGAEAMAAGLPVIACRYTAVPETLGEAALYVDAADPSSVLQAVERLWNERDLRSRLVQAGRQRAEYWTWSACVDRLHQALITRLS